ncbi:MAG: PQQ-binding-like beta-propeller repeat protein, partial [Clostridia bacterium]|nr:PQQ-binding-like beta-propeller repeat protein [Clostridia bacterium]
MQKSCLVRRKIVSLVLALLLGLSGFSGLVMAEDLTEELGEEESLTETALEPEADLSVAEALHEEEPPALEENLEDLTEETEVKSATSVTAEPLTEPVVRKTSLVEADWAGAFNLTPDNNNLTSVALPVSAAGLVESWKCRVSAASMMGSYAGQVVIVDGYLYTTGTDGLLKIDQKTGDIEETVSGVGSRGHWYYDYLAYGEGKIFVATQTDISAYDLENDLAKIWSATLENGYYHPLVYHKGLLYCNGNVLKAEDGTIVYTLDGNFNWSAGAFVTLSDGQMEAYYISDLNFLYAVNAQTGEPLDQWNFDQGTYDGSSASPVAYSSANNRLYWGNSNKGEFYSVQIDQQTGELVEDSKIIQDQEAYKTSCAPVIYQDRVYSAGKDGKVYVYDAETLDSLGVTSNDIGEIRSTPLLCTAYEEETDKVYLLMQSTNVPGSIYVLEEDYNDSVDPTLQFMAKPSVSTNLAYAFEQLAFDSEGALYCYNEAGYFFKFAVSAARLNSLEVKEALNDLSFSSAVAEYQVVMPQSSGQATVRFTLPSASSCEVKAGGAVLSPVEVEQVWQVEIPLNAGSGSAQITVTDINKEQRVYSLNFVPASSNAQLADLVVKSKGNVSAAVLSLTPKFAT